jgi:hypothetical protein
VRSRIRSGAAPISLSPLVHLSLIYLSRMQWGILRRERERGRMGRCSRQSIHQPGFVRLSSWSIPAAVRYLLDLVLRLSSLINAVTCIHGAVPSVAPLFASSDMQSRPALPLVTIPARAHRFAVHAPALDAPHLSQVSPTEPAPKPPRSPPPTAIYISPFIIWRSFSSDRGKIRSFPPHPGDHVVRIGQW